MLGFCISGVSFTSQVLVQGQQLTLCTLFLWHSAGGGQFYSNRFM